MSDERGIENGKQARQYLRSKGFRICSWLSVALVAAFFLVPHHSIWFLCAAVALYVAAMLPVLRLAPYNRSLDVHNQRHRRYLLFVAVYVAVIVIGAFVVTYFATRR